MLKGLTVYYLFKDIFPLKKDDVFLFHASAGGAGLIACQWARHLGAKLIGTVSSDEKANISKEHGAWETINYKTEDLPQRIYQLANEKKAPVVYDGVGKATCKSSLDSLSPRGVMVSFGNVSDELFQLVGKGIIKTDCVKTFRLHETVQAHQELNDRSRVGSLILVPQPRIKYPACIQQSNEFKIWTNVLLGEENIFHLCPN